MRRFKLKRITSNGVLAESEEQKILVRWLEVKGLKFTAIPNSTFTRSWKQKAHNKATGLRAGLPDLVIVLPNKILFLELKREKGGVLSADQKGWIEAINAVGGSVEAIVCRGAQQAIIEIEERIAPKK